MSQSHIRLAEVLKKLPLPATPKWKHGVFDIEIMRYKGLSVLLYQPSCITALKSFPLTL